MTASAKQTFSSAGGIALCSLEVVGTDTGVAMRDPLRTPQPSRNARLSTNRQTALKKS